MPFVYSNYGFSMRAVDEGYYPVSGEIISDTLLSENEIILAFPEYLSQKILAERAALPDLTRRQAALGMMSANIISAPEALLMVQTAAPPAAVKATLDLLAEPDKTKAYIDFASDTYQRTNPLLVGVANAAEITPEALDALWAQWALL